LFIHSNERAQFFNILNGKLKEFEQSKIAISNDGNILINNFIFSLFDFKGHLFCLGYPVGWTHFKDALSRQATFGGQLQPNISTESGLISFQISKKNLRNIYSI